MGHKVPLTSLTRLIVTLAVGGVADALNIVDTVAPIIYIPVDCVTVLVFLAAWGFRPELLAVLIAEMIPGLNVLPTWVAVALYLYGKSGSTPNGHA